MDAARHGLDVGQSATEPLLDARAELGSKRVVEDAERVRPELVHGLVQTLASFVGGEQTVDPHLGVHAVVRLLAIHLCRETRDLGIVGLLERREPDLVRGLVEPVTRDRPRPLEPAQLDERRGAVLLGLAVERELVGGRAELRGSELVERSRVPDLVLRDRREGDVLLEERRDARPLRVAPAEDELVVGDREEEVGAVAHAASPAPGAMSSVPARSRASCRRALIE